MRQISSFPETCVPALPLSLWEYWSSYSHHHCNVKGHLYKHQRENSLLNIIFRNFQPVFHLFLSKIIEPATVQFVQWCSEYCCVQVMQCFINRISPVQYLLRHRVSTVRPSLIAVSVERTLVCWVSAAYYCWRFQTYCTLLNYGCRECNVASRSTRLSAQTAW